MQQGNSISQTLVKKNDYNDINMCTTKKSIKDVKCVLLLFIIKIDAKIKISLKTILIKARRY